MEDIFFTPILDSAEDFNNLPAENFKCAINFNRWDLSELLKRQGYFFADRTIKASIPLKASFDFKKFCRLEIEETAINERICEIAKKSFTEDVRFWRALPPKFDEQLLNDYLSPVQKIYVCRCKNEIAGFLEAVYNPNGGGATIRLAAVDEKYRLSGAALSLYAGVADLLCQKNIRRLEGRISTKNMSVLNLYVALGANFSLPLDIYIRS